MKAKFFKNIGTSQQSRQFQGLDPEYVKIDERSFEDMLVFTSGLSKLINFYNEQNRIDGDWSYFFADETVILASIIDSQPVAMEEQFKTNIYKAQRYKKPERKLKYLRKCFNEIFDVALMFEDWYKKLKSIEEFTLAQVSIRNEIANAISSKLSEALKQLKGLDLGASDRKALGTTVDFDYQRFSDIWALDEVAPNVLAFTGRSKKQRIESIIVDLQQIFQGFYETLLYLKSKTPEYLKESLNSDIHYPEIALYITFLKLFENAQDNINLLIRRHIDFYYTKVLRQKNKPVIFDQVYLQFSLDDGAPYARVPKDTVFVGEQDEAGNDLLYIGDEELLVNRAKVKQIKTVYIDQRLLNIKSKEKLLISNVLRADFPVSLYSADSDTSQPRKSFAVFGEDQTGKGVDERTMQNAKIGFTVASPSLYLKEGLREVELVLQFNERTYAGFLNFLKDLSVLNESSVEEVFIKVFLESFILSITTDKGWHTIRQHVITKQDDQYCLKINFDMLPTEPSIIGFDADLHTGGYKTDLPLLEVVLNSNSYVYAYSLLSNLEVEQITINTKVSGFKSLELFNNIGQLNPDTPFLPFGPTPKAGSYFIIGSNEIFNKSLDDLRINIEWFDLPVHKSGFSSHYAEYNMDIDNTSFETNISILDSGRWKPQDKTERQSFKLFRTEREGSTANPAPQSKLMTDTVISDVDVKKVKQPAKYEAINESLTYTSLSDRGFLRLELSAPQNGFFHDIYPSILSEVTIENSRGGLLKNKEKSKKALPKAPYTPTIQSISVDYSASTTISLIEQNNNEDNQNRGKFFYIHPFGQNQVYPDNSKQKTYLLPDYNFQGSLLLGFADLKPPQLLTVLFEMIDEYTVSSEEDPPIIEWSYLSGNEWYTLAPSKILRDDTNRFLRTGIVLLEIPSEISNGNTVLDAELYWIRATVTDNINTASNILRITTQVITATLDPNANVSGSHLHEPMAAYTINRSVENIEGIQSVRQPLPSFRGRPPENPMKFYTRVGERLHHKQRAVSTWDFERIILEKFDQLYKVNCLPNMTSNRLDRPGNVLIVVTPHARYSADPNEPMASSELLLEIKSYIQSFTSPFVKLEVRNPNYERIKIICAVKFTDGFNYGFHIQKLNEQINKYLTGTLLTQNRKVELGGTVHSSDILSFMRTLPYVNFITKFSMIQVARDFQGNYQLIDTAREGDVKSSLSATKPWSVLVPAPVHQISVLVDREEQKSRQAGIDYLELGHDFIIED